ncbi:phosphonate C-P lyase system protein PhnL [Roseomonas gilardii]|uniref:Phosphonate C-P lyase system protein PhnL n=2 Tax=Roseomonas gilardii TaxID=257708 RepID=A0A1L7AIG8_9PROT|nr:phosphonate C-P lyase system protein PhnL [Roseomonas gilardii]
MNPSMNGPLVALDGVGKTFTLHLRGGTRLGVVDGVSFSVDPGECVVLGGPSGAGKSSLLRMIYGNYRCDTGRILIRDGEEMVDVANAGPRRVLALRRTTMGYVSQFLRVIPRVGAREIVAAAGREGGLDAETASARAAEMLAALNLPERLWDLPPATFSGGEQQRVNIARGLIAERPVLLLDEPTASLDARNRAVVVEMIRRKSAAGVAMIGIFHDEDVRDAVASRVVDVTRFSAAPESQADAA